MKKQNGFVPLLIVVLIALVLVVAGGGYVVYKDQQQQKIDKQNVQNLLNSQAKAQIDTNTTQPTAPVSNPVPSKTVTTNTSVSAKVSTTLNCDNSFDCLINAATQCQSASGTFAYTNVPYPSQDPHFTYSSYVFSGKTQFEIKKTANQCSEILSYLKRTVSINSVGRANMIVQGKTNADVDAMLQSLNDAFSKSAPFAQTCSMNPVDLSDSFTYRKLIGPSSYAAFDLNVPGVLSHSPSGGQVQCSPMEGSK